MKLLLFFAVLLLSVHSLTLPSFYHTSQDISDSLVNLQTTCKQHYKLETILDEPAIHLITITGKSPSQNKQKIFYLFGEHPRELISSETGLSLAKTLCGVNENSKSNPFLNIQNLLQNNIFQIVINANPLGRLEVEKGDFCKRTNEHGVDLNRNWDEHWQALRFGEDPELNPGLLAFSELETQKLKEALASFSPKLFVSIHSGQLAMFTPYAYEGKEPITNGDNMLKALDVLNKDYCDCKMGAAGLKVGYKSPGTSLDYAYDQLKVPFSYVFEIYSQYDDVPAVSKQLLLLQQFMLRPFEMNMETIQKMMQESQSTQSESCFLNFNPDDQDVYNVVVENWTKNESIEKLLTNARSLQEVDLTGSSFWIKTKQISPNTQRFEAIDNKILFISTNSMDEFKKSFEDFVHNSCEELYVRGPAGVGKSFCILYLVLLLRREKTRRVLYINNPNEFNANSVEYLVRELVYTMADDFDIWEQDHSTFPFQLGQDQSPKVCLLKLLSELEFSHEPEPCLQILKDYYEYCHKIRRYLFIFVDQYTQLQRLREKSVKLDQFCNTLFTYSHRKIFETSDSFNQAAHPEFILEKKFTLPEAILFLAEKLTDSLDDLGLPPATSTENSSEVVVLEEYPNFARLQDSTDLLPYELQTFCTAAKKNPQKDFNQVFEAFYKKRYLEVVAIHTNWQRNYSFLKEEDALKNIFKMSLGLRDRDLLQGLLSPDPNLFYIDTKVSPEEIRFSSRVVEKSLYRLYSEKATWTGYVENHLEENLKALKTLIQGNQERSGFKGTLFEKYFSYKMEIASNRGKIASEMFDKKLFQLQYMNSSKKEQNIDLSEISSLKKFDDTELFSLLEFYYYKDIFIAFIPNFPEFAHADFLFFDSRNGQHIIYLIQTTTDLLSHKKSSTLLSKEISELKAAKTNKEKLIELKKTCSPLALALFEASTKIPNIQHEFIWVGLAWDKNYKKYLTEASEIFKKSVVLQQDHVALVQANQLLFDDILSSMESAA